MSLIAIPKTWANGEIITHTDLNANFSAIFGDYNGGITDANIASGANINANKLLAASIITALLADALITDAKINWSSVLALRVGPTAAASGNGLRVARGSKAVTFNGAGVGTATITFATDSLDGNPNFAVAPIVICTMVRDGGGAAVYRLVQTPAATTVNVGLSIDSSNAADATTQHVAWIAIGEV